MTREERARQARLERYSMPPDPALVEKYGAAVWLDDGGVVLTTPGGDVAVEYERALEMVDELLTALETVGYPHPYRQVLSQSWRRRQQAWNAAHDDDTA